MGKQCSCIATIPNEHRPTLNDQISDVKVSSNTHVHTLKIETSRCQTPKMDSVYAQLLINGYIRCNRLSSKAFDANVSVLCRQYYYNEEALVRKRCIFLSLMHLNLCIKQIPETVLNESIFCFKANKAALLSKLNVISDDLMLQNGYSTPSETMEARSGADAYSDPVIASLSSSTTLNPLTIKYCTEKMSNGLLLLLEDTTTWKVCFLRVIICPFWSHQNNTKGYIAWFM